MKTEKEIKSRIENLKEQIREMNKSGGYMIHSRELAEELLQTYTTTGNVRDYTPKSKKEAL